jgi:hypothetical protein
MPDADADFARAVEEGTLPPADWNHRAHVRLAFVYLQGRSFDDALGRMREELHRQVARREVVDALESGYHETMTVAWLRLVRSAMADHGPYDSFDALAREHPHLLERRLLRVFYSRARLTTWDAKRAFLDGDLAALPPAR